MHKNTLSIAFFLFSFLASHFSLLISAGPKSVGEVLKFDPVIQADPRINFSSGVEESVSPTSGALSVKIPVFSLPGKGGMDLNASFDYNSSMVSVYNEDEIGGGPFSHICFIQNLNFKNEVSGLFYTKYGVSSWLGYVSEGMMQDVVGLLLKFIPGGDVMDYLQDFFHFDSIDNTTVHVFIPQMQLSVSEVRGIIGSVQPLTIFDLVNPLNDVTVYARSIHPMQNLNVILKNGTTVNFEKKTRNNTIYYSNSQPDDHYSLTYDNNQELYIFNMGDGVKYKIKPYVLPMLYAGFAQLEFSPNSLASIVGSINLPNWPGGVSSVTNITKYVDNFIIPLKAVLEKAGAEISVYCIPYGLIQEIQDTHDNKISIDYDKSGLFKIPDKMEKVTDSLNRVVTFDYEKGINFNYLGLSLNIFQFSDFFTLNQINMPDGRKYSIKYDGDFNRTSPIKMEMHDFENRSMTCFFKSTPPDLNPLIADIKSDFFYLNRIDYPLGGFVEYDVNPLDSKIENHYFYKDMNLTHSVVMERHEHSAKPGLGEDIVNTTRFDYNYPSHDDTITTGALYWHPPSTTDLLSGDVMRMVGSLVGGLYIKNVKEVLGGTTTIYYQNGKTEKYYQRKSNPGNYNHYIWTIGITGVSGLGTIFEFPAAQIGYKPARTLLNRVEEKADGCEDIVKVNFYDDKWNMIEQDTTKGYLQYAYKFNYDAFGQIKEDYGPLNMLTKNEIPNLTQRNLTKYLYEDNNNYKNDDPFLIGTVKRKEIGNQTGNQVAEFYYDEGNPSSYGYKGDLTKTIQKCSDGDVVREMQYNSDGTLKKEKDGNGNISDYTYDYNFEGDKIKHENRMNVDVRSENGELNHEEIISTKIFGQGNYFLMREIDGKENITAYENDNLGRVRRVVFPDSTDLSYTYNDAQGDLFVDVKDAEQKKYNNAFLRYRYDGLGRLKSFEQNLETGEVYKSDNFYNIDGTLSSVRDAQNRETFLTYDKYNRLLGIKYPDNTELKTKYNYQFTSGEYKQEVVDANNVATGYIFDIKGRLGRVIEPDSTGKDTIYSYDNVGNLLSFIDRRTPSSDKTVEYKYNELNQLKQEKYRDGTSYNYEYDFNGNIIRKRDANGQGGLFGLGSYDIFYTYDQLNRLVNTKYPSGVLNSRFSFLITNVSYGFDNNNNRIWMKDSVGTHRYFYNARNWLTNEVQDYTGNGLQTYNIQYGYNMAGDLVKEIYPSGKIVQHTINTIHRVKDVNLLNSPPTLLASYSYNPMGTVKEINFGNGTKQTFDYDLRERVKVLKLLDSQSSLLLSQFYNYDSVGNRTRMAEENGLVTGYEYDGLYRLTKVKYPGSVPNKEVDATYSYDSMGNRLSHRYSYGLNQYTYAEDSDKLSKVTMDAKASIEYQWDKNGNQIKETHKRMDKIIKEVNLSWDFENRLMEMRYPYTSRLKFKGKESIQDSVLTFGYDGDGNRTIKQVKNGNKVKSEKIYIRNSSGQVIEEYESRDNAVKTNIYIGGVLRIANNKKEFEVKDTLGSKIALLDEIGKMIQRNKYNEFGTLDYSKGSSDNKYLFTGKELDDESGFDYFGFRYYDPLTGRWISKDNLAGKTVEPQSLNRYQYCLNNPFVYVDPDGNEQESSTGGVPPTNPTQNIGGSSKAVMGSVNKVKPNSPRQLSRKNTSKSSPNNFRHPNDVSAPPQTPAGQWIEANESMSPSSRAYQKFITGTDKVFSRYGVKFDGAEGDTLIEAKGSYSSFVNSSTGRFFGWFKGSKGLVDQANRQIVAADGAPIKWYFADQKSLNATQTLFKQNGVNGITLEYKPMK